MSATNSDRDRALAQAIAVDFGHDPERTLEGLDCTDLAALLRSHDELYRASKRLERQRDGYKRRLAEVLCYEPDPEP